MSCRPVLLAAVVLSLAACGAEPQVNVTPDDNALPGETTCDPGDVQVGNGAPRVGRGASLTFDVSEPPTDLRVWVSGPAGKQAGAMYKDNGRALFMPTDPWPANATMTWNIEMCGETFSGTFETGSLIRPVTASEIDDGFVGETFAIDLRAGTWVAPAAAPRTTMRLGGALLVDVLARDAATVTLAVSAAKPDNSAGYERLEEAVAMAHVVSLADNPYVVLDLDGITMPTTHGQVILRDATLVLGLSLDGIEDGRLAGTLDVSGIGDGDDFAACTLLAADGIECEPCDDGQCVTVVVDDVFGLSL